MFDKLLASEAVSEAVEILCNDMPFALWETAYVTVLSTLFAVIIGLPLGVLLVVGEKGGVLPLPKWLMGTLNVVINLLRSIPSGPSHRRNDGRHNGFHSSAGHSRLPLRGKAR